MEMAGPVGTDSREFYGPLAIFILVALTTSCTVNLEDKGHSGTKNDFSLIPDVIF